jgi:TPR repeat protein
MTHATRFVAVVAFLAALVLCVPVQAQTPEIDEALARAEAGDAEAQRNLGVRYATGRGVSKDDAEAMRWFRLAADQGHASAQFDLGVRYVTGRGVSKDDAEAMRWYRLAADQGHADAQHDLGFMYATGSRFLAEAVRWFRLAADQGHAGAQANLGLSYESGRGVQKDYVLAHMWFNLAASRATGEQRRNAVENRDILAGRMDPTEIAEAQRLAREWDEAQAREP